MSLITLPLRQSKLNEASPGSVPGKPLLQELDE
jgi:hypothetical protein